MTGGVLSNSVVGRSVFGPYACLDVTTYRIGSGLSVGRCVKVCGREACLRGAKGRCCGRPSVGLQSSLTHSWHDSRMCSKVLLQLVPDASTPRLLNALQKGCRPCSEKVHRLDVRAVRELTGSILGGEGLRFAVVAARFNEIVTRPLVAGALETFHKYAVKDEDVDLVWVPGSFEIPLVAQQMAKSGKYEAVLAIGAVIRGATTHYDAVAGSAASGLMSASLNSGVPVIFGILTTENMDQAIDRAGGKVGNKGAEAALTAIEMASLFKHQITPLRDTQ